MATSPLHQAKGPLKPPAPMTMTRGKMLQQMAAVWNVQTTVYSDTTIFEKAVIAKSCTSYPIVSGFIGCKCWQMISYVLYLWSLLVSYFVVCCLWINLDKKAIPPALWGLLFVLTRCLNSPWFSWPTHWHPSWKGGSNHRFPSPRVTQHSLIASNLPCSHEAKATATLREQLPSFCRPHPLPRFASDIPADPPDWLQYSIGPFGAAQYVRGRFEHYVEDLSISPHSIYSNDSVRNFFFLPSYHFTEQFQNKEHCIHWPVPKQALYPLTSSRTRSTVSTPVIDLSFSETPSPTPTPRSQTWSPRSKKRVRQLSPQIPLRILLVDDVSNLWPELNW